MNLLSNRYLVLSFGLTAFTIIPSPAQHNTDTSRRWTRDTVILKDVIIKATRRMYSEQQIDRTIVHINALPSNAGLHIVDILNNTPGIMVEDNGNISIYGKDQASVFIDDKPVYLTGKELLNYLQSLPSGILDKIEIMPNPPARYAANGMGGIILIRTKKTGNRGFNGNLILNYGQGVYPKSNSSFICNYRDGHMNVYGMATYSQPHTCYTAERDRAYHFPNGTGDYNILQHNAEINFRWAYSYKSGIDIDLDKSTSLSLSGKSYMSPYRETGHYTTGFYTGRQPDSIVYSNSYLRTYTTHYLLNLGILHHFSNPLKEWSLNMDYLTMNDQGNQVLNSNTFTSGGNWQNNNTLFSFNPFKVYVYSVMLDAKTPVAGLLTLETGLQSSFSSRESNGNYLVQDTTGLHPANSLNNSFHFNENINAIYGSLNGQYKKLTWKVGFRMEHTHVNASILDIQYTDLFPTVYLQYKLDSGPQQALRFSFGKRITRPDYQSYNPSIFFFNSYTYITGNSLLQPQYNYEAALSYSHTRIISIGLQYNRSSNYLLTAYKQVDKALVVTNANIDRSNSIGINVTNALPLAKWWTVNLYQELTLNTYMGSLFSGNDLLNNQLTSYRVNANQQFTFGKGWSADLAAVYRSNNLYGQAIIKAVWQVHAGLQKQFDKHSTFNISVRDLFHSWSFKRHIEIPGAIVDVSNQSDSRFISFTWNYRFGSNALNRERKSALQTEAGRAGISNN